jgi:hypothetical protein
MFNSAECMLARDAARLGGLVSLVQESLGEVQESLDEGTRVVAVLEIGSFAKDEAVPSSDIDTRFYVRGRGLRHINLLHEREPPAPFWAYMSACAGARPAIWRWEEFNAPISRRASAVVGQNVTLAVADVGYATFLLDRLAGYPSAEHALLFQSNVLYDPEGFLECKRSALDGVVIPELVHYYGERVRWRLGRLPGYCRPHPADASKLGESGQVLWVAHAVRCLRDAVARQTFAQTGRFTYRKGDVLDFVTRNYPEHSGLVQRLYLWKTDPDARAVMVAAFRADPSPLYREFEELTPALERAVRVMLDDA